MTTIQADQTQIGMQASHQDPVAAEMTVQERLQQTIKNKDIVAFKQMIGSFKPDENLIFDCIESDFQEGVEYLASLGCELNEPHSDNWIDGDVPIVICAKKQNIPMTMKLLSLGAKADSKNGKETALAIWCEHGNIQMVSELLKAGANPNITFGDEDKPSSAYLVALNKCKSEGGIHLSILTLLARHTAISTDLPEEVFAEEVLGNLTAFCMILQTEPNKANVEYFIEMATKHECLDALDAIHAFCGAE